MTHMEWEFQCGEARQNNFEIIIFKHDKQYVVLWLYNNSESHHRAGQRITLYFTVYSLYEQS